MHKELTVGFQTEIDAIPDELVFARCKIKGYKEPIKFTIGWGGKVSPEVRSDLRNYLYSEENSVSIKKIRNGQRTEKETIYT